MPNPHEKPNYFARVLISLLCIFLVFMITYKFLGTDPKGSIDAGILALVALVLVLVLAETFDNFSVGKLISVSRIVANQKEEIITLEDKNEKLLSQVLSFSSTQNQHQSHLTVNGDYHVTSPKVTPASQEEAEENDERASARSTDKITTPNAREATVYKTINWRAAEAEILPNFLRTKNLDQTHVIQNAKLSDMFTGIDPIGDQPIIFDAFTSQNDTDVFIEIRSERMTNHPVFRDRIYVMLSKINLYRQATKKNAYLELVTMRLPNELGASPASRNMKVFAQALASGLLRTTEVELTDEQVKRFTNSD